MTNLLLIALGLLGLSLIIATAADFRQMRREQRQDSFRRLLRTCRAARRRGELRGIASEQRRLAQRAGQVERTINRRMVIGMSGDNISGVGRN